MIRDAPSPNHDARPEGVPVDMLVLHTTGLRSAQHPASPHYAVEADGLVWQRVPEARRAWHAGVSHWRGHSTLNDRSIGIEIVGGDRCFPALQMAAVCDLCLAVLARHPIPPRNVVAHGDVAPDVDQDPGEPFDWQGLAANGVGLWPGAPAAPVPDALAALATIGYRTDLPAPALLRAFQRHWTPDAVTGRPDPATRARLAAVVACLDGAGP